MKRTLFLSLFFAVLAAGLLSQQAGFVDTYLEIRSSVIDFREEGLPGCFRDEVLVNPSPADLQVGDIFIDVDGGAKLVIDIEKIGSELYIDTVKPNLGQVLCYADIPEQTISFTQDNFIPETLAGGELASAGRSASGKGFSASFYYEGLKNAAETLYLRAGGSINLDAGITISGNLPYLDWWTPRDGYVNCALTYDADFSVGFAASFEGGKKLAPKQLIAGFGTPSIGVEAGMGLYFETGIEGSVKISIDGKLGFSGKAGGSCALGGLYIFAYPKNFTPAADNFSDVYVQLVPKLAVEGKLSPGLSARAVVKFFSLDISEFEAGGGFYVKLSGEASANMIKYSFSSRTGTSDFSQPEELKLTAWGELGIHSKVSGKVFQGQWAWELVNLEFPFIKFGYELSATHNGFFWATPFYMGNQPQWISALRGYSGAERLAILLNPSQASSPLAVVSRGGSL